MSCRMWQHCGYHTEKRYRSPWVKARGAAQHPTMHTEPCPPPHAPQSDQFTVNVTENSKRQYFIPLLCRQRLPWERGIKSSINHFDHVKLTFSLLLFGLVVLRLAKVASFSIVPRKRWSEWEWNETVPLGSFLILIAWFLWAESISYKWQTKVTLTWRRKHQETTTMLS